jgi:hypothetical protein
MTLFAKLWTDVLGDEKLMRAARKGSRNVHWLPWLIAFAKRADDNGRLTVNGEAAEPVDIANLVPNSTPRAVAAACTELIDIGVLVRHDDGVLAFSQWEKRAGGKPSDTPDAVRTRVHRHRAARKKPPPNGSDVTRSVTPVTRYGNAGETPAPSRERARESREEREERREEEEDAPRAAPATASTDKAWQPVRESDLADRFEREPDKQALATLLARVSSKVAVEGCIGGWLDGIYGQPVPTSPEMALAIHDFNANGCAWNASHFRAYVRRAVSTTRDAPSPRAQSVASLTFGGSAAARGADIFAAIMALVETNDVPGQQRARFIRRERVRELGPEIDRAYEQFGGARRFLDCPPDKLVWLQRDFSQLLEGRASA